MSGLLEVIALHDSDAKRAEAGGADRIELVGTMNDDGLAPTPEMVAKVCRSVTIPVRPMVRLRAGFGTDGGEVTRMVGLISSYLDAGAEGFVMGYLNGLGLPDLEVMATLLDGGDWPWTFHRAIDYTLETDRAWKILKTIPRLNQVLTAGSVRGVDYGLDDLLQRAKSDPKIAQLMMAGGGLKAEHVPWLVRAGVMAFHVGSSVRPTSSYKAYVDDALVRTWRNLIDTEVSNARK